VKSNLRHLRVFLTIAETGTITRGAKLCNVSQPAVTQAKAKLERLAGQALFQRKPQELFVNQAGEVLALRTRRAHGVVATRAAQLLAQADRLAFVELDQARSDLAKLQGREVGRIVIRAMLLSRSFIRPRATGRFRQDRPTLPIRALDGPMMKLGEDCAKVRWTCWWVPCAIRPRLAMWCRNSSVTTVS
jgi:LysR family transcriptional regulator, regulator for genes of the gallate degradation pathway